MAVTALKQKTTRVIGLGVQTLELDLAAVTAIDAAGVGELVQIQNQCDRIGGRLILIRPGPCIRRVLSLCGLDEVFEMRELESPSLDSLRSDSPVHDRPAHLLAAERHEQRSRLESTVAVR